MGASDQRSGRGTAGSTDMISRSISFCSHQELKSSSPPKMMFDANPLGFVPDLSMRDVG
jgi:hypothetical protein